MIDHPLPYNVDVTTTVDHTGDHGWVFKCDACGSSAFVWEYKLGTTWMQSHARQVMREGMPVTWEINRRQR